MPVNNRIASFAPDMTAWRRHLHRMPEIGFECQRTAAFVAGKLREFGIDDIHEGIATSGIVAIIQGRGEGPTLGLRADMDALPISEETGAEHASEVPGAMHACGHDGHTVMLLGAAKYLAETRNFAGRVALIFQPAEEGFGGGRVMVDEGIMERFDIARVFAIHNMPNEPFGHFLTRPGPIMASADTATVRVIGRGGHGATPHETADPVVAIAAMVSALQTIVARNVAARDEAVVSVTMIHAGSATNIVPGEGSLAATIRSFSPDVRDLLRARFCAIVEGTARAFGVEAEIDYATGYPPTVNDAPSVELAARVAGEVAGIERVDTDANRLMASEDFAYMLEKRPGAYLLLGTGPGAGLHHPGFDFNDDAAPIGASFLATLVERALPATGDETRARETAGRVVL